MVIFLLVMDSTIYSFDWALINLILLSFSSLVLVLVWKWQMKNRNKEMLPVRLESITVQIVLLIYSFEFFFYYYYLFLFLVNHTKGKRVPITKFWTQQKTILEQIKVTLCNPTFQQQTHWLHYNNFHHLFLKCWQKNNVYGCCVLYFSFQATFWIPLWIELWESDRNIPGDHTTIVL